MEPPETYARKTLVERLAATGKPDDFSAAQDVAGKMADEELKKGVLADPDVLLLKAGLDVQQPETIARAKDNCKRATQLAPNSAAPCIMLSMIAQAEGDSRTASEESSKALGIEPTSSRALTLRIETLRREGRFAEARVLLDRLPGDPLSLALTRADLLAGESGGTAALDYLKKQLTALKPDTPAGLKVAFLLRIARHLEDAGNTTEAEAQLREAHKLSPDAADVVATLCRLLDGQKRFTESDQLFDEIMKGKTGQTLASLQMMRADFLLARRDPKSIAEAERLAKAALEINPNSSLAYRILGDAAYAAKQPKAAINHYRKALDLDFRNSFASNNLAWVLCETGDPKSALPHAQNAVFLSPTNASFLDTLGEVSYKLGDYRKSEDALARAVEIAPDAAGSWVRLARAYLKLARLDDAERALGKAEEIGQGDRKLSQEQKNEMTSLLERINKARKKSTR